MHLPSPNDVIRVYKKIRPHIVKTPLLESERLNRFLGVHLLIKAENLQKSGAFKYRGAKSAIMHLEERGMSSETPILSWSSGNHGRAIAETAQQHGFRAIIVIPETAPKIKRDAIRSAGAEIILYQNSEIREDVGASYAQQEKAEIIPPYDNPVIICGQASVGVEIADQLQERRINAHAIFIPCGGGGLSAGIALASQIRMPRTQLFGVEPEGFDDTHSSFKHGRVESNPIDTPPSICDALMTPKPGELTFAINHHALKEIIVIADEETKKAVKILFEEFKLVTEASGAIALAAIIKRKHKLQGKTIVAIASGGNVDSALFARLLS